MLSLLGSLIFTRVGRMGLLVILGAALAGGIYLKIRHDAIASYEAQIIADENKRIKDAIRKGDDADKRPPGDDGVRHDPHCRDC